MRGRQPFSSLPHSPFPISHWGGAIALLLMWAAAAPAQLAPGAGYIFPAGGRAGTTVEVRLGGYDWTPDMQFFVHDRRILLEVLGPPGELLIPPPPYWFGGRSKVPALPIPREVPARFVLPADLPPGPVRWQAANANGATTTGTFIVGDGREVVEDERRKGPQVLPDLPVVVSGRLLKNEEVDRYRFTTRRSGAVTCVLTARRLGANFHGALEVRDDKGGLVAESVDTEGLDPALTFAARAGAEYTLGVRDIDHAGDRSFVYRLALTPGPRVLAALPAAGRRGETRLVEFVGVGVATGVARLESVERLVTFPADPESTAFDYRLETPGGAAPPFRLLVSDLPETVLLDCGRKHVPLSPGAITTFFDSAEGDHRYPLFCRKGERWTIAAQARELGSPLDLTLAVLGPDGKELARSDDLPGTTDPGLDFTAPVDGPCTLVVGDVARLAGSRAAVYRLVVRRPAEDFALTVPAQRLALHIGQKVTLTVKAARSGGFAGPIALAVEGLPPDVRTPPNLVIPADKSELAVVLEASAEAPAAAALVRVAGTARIGDRTVTRPARATTTGNLAPRAPEENETATLIVATTLKPRCKGEPVDKDTGRKVPRGSTFPAEVTLQRLDGYQGEVVLKMAAQQSYQVQGITGRDVVVPPGVSRTVYPCFMPEWLETSRTSRMAMIAVARVADPRGNVRHCVAGIDGMVTMTMEGALLKVSHYGHERVAQPGRPFTVRVKVARSARLPEPVRLELRPPEELVGVMKAEPVVVQPGQNEVDFVITTADDPRVLGEKTLTIRGTAWQKSDLPVVSETAVTVAFSR
jgi:hypothetical protein